MVPPRLFRSFPIFPPGGTLSCPLPPGPFPSTGYEVCGRLLSVQITPPSASPSCGRQLPGQFRFPWPQSFFLCHPFNCGTTFLKLDLHVLRTSIGRRFSWKRGATQFPPRPQAGNDSFSPSRNLPPSRKCRQSVHAYPQTSFY